MFCPSCKSEYRQGFTKCADCEVSLVEVLAEEAQPDADPHDLVPVFETSSQPDILVIKSALDAEGINPTTILEHHSSLKSFSSGDATDKRGGSAAESIPQAIMP